MKALGHKAVTDLPVAPGCSEPGLTVGSHCSVCGVTITKQETVPAKGHSWDAGTVTKEPTEKTEGTRTHKCTACGESKTETIPVLGHTHSYESVVTAPTCTAKGYTTHTCACGHSYTDSHTEPVPHTEVADAAIAATCTESGLSEGKHCSVCGAVTSVQVSVPAKGHIWDEGTVTREPTETEQGEKRFTCTACGSEKTGTIPVLGHSHNYESVVVAPTCTENGYTEHTCHCGDSYRDTEVPAAGHTWDAGEVLQEATETVMGIVRYCCTLCGEESTEIIPVLKPTEPTGSGIERLAGSNRFDTAFKVADQMKKNLGIEKFDSIIVASGINFADALSGSYLAAVKNAPILLSFTTDSINNQVKDYIRSNLNPGGTVYILGGESAVPVSMETGLEGFQVNRLKGDDRFGTNLAILAEAGVGDKPVLVCTGLSFADSLSASAAELPILLVWKNLTETQKAFLGSLKGNEFYVIGGESAVSKSMEEQIAAYGVTERVQGANRFETSIAIAERFFYKPETAVVAYAWNFPDGLCGGPLAATMDAPLILTMDKYEARAAEYLQAQPIREATILGGESLIPEKSVEKIFGTK